MPVPLAARGGVFQKASGRIASGGEGLGSRGDSTETAGLALG